LLSFEPICKGLNLKF